MIVATRQDEELNANPSPVVYPDVSSGQERVTAQEFARSMAVLEAQLAEKARADSETLTIEEAIRQLGLQASPEQVWEIVQRQRQEHEHHKVNTARKRRILLTAMLV